MKSRWFLTRTLNVVVATLLVGCGGKSNNAAPIDSDSGKTEIGVNVHELNERFYYMLPVENTSKSYKLLFAFHGSGGSGQGMAGMTRLHEQSDDYLVVYPKSKNEEWNEGCGCNKAHRLGVDDLGFVDDMVAELKAKYQIIDGEIYATGFSQGGLFVQNLLCNRSEVFNAIVTVGAPMSYQLGDSCNLTTPTNYRIMHGKADSVLPYNGKSHANFGLLSSPQAIKIVGDLNYEAALSVEQDLDDGVTLTHYPNRNIQTQLISVDGAGHSWNLSPVKTTQSIMEFFESTSQYALPAGSDLIKVSDNYYHVRHLTHQADKPTVVMLSGANMHFHSDSAWFALLQPYLSTQFNVYVIDRLGQGLSSNTSAPSMQKFATDLPVLFEKLDLSNVHLVSFANSNSVPLIAMQQSEDFKQKIASMLWMDPDILLPHSIAQYQGYPVDIYREWGQHLIDHVSAGKWQEKMNVKIAEEQAHVESLLEESEFAQHMDWGYFNQIMQTRYSIEAQLIRVNEMMNYHDDLELVRNWQPDSSIPITVIDSEFEQLDIEKAETEEARAGLIKWEAEGRKWSQEVAEISGGQYLPITSTEHLIPLTHPELIKQALIELSSR
ncbi:MULTISPECIES: alpha/beta hydrolase [Pseudoalteromonas]|uniref:alpha/beta hydrolase n=1 Tax=Pseudoalteromonas TaxID=53246 RepID=UPI000FFE4E30|nr:MULTISPECIES: alpha/beta hydrolase [Pseudoalteromonas]MCG9760386.1 alpha/beta hydrolase [Pseudoalteromonas sp. Isolate6]NKC20009.1 alpha/beta hydrolase [Pseudoalteromonas galatheae]RXE85645.1 alpha/beta hydrolase [Pseudoalteromonas sp. A757]